LGPSITVIIFESIQRVLTGTLPPPERALTNMFEKRACFPHAETFTCPGIDTRGHCKKFHPIDLAIEVK
jgi:hypothetical protein